MRLHVRLDGIIHAHSLRLIFLMFKFLDYGRKSEYLQRTQREKPRRHGEMMWTPHRQVQWRNIVNLASHFTNVQQICCSDVFITSFHRQWNYLSFKKKHIIYIFLYILLEWGYTPFTTRKYVIMIDNGCHRGETMPLTPPSLNVLLWTGVSSRNFVHAFIGGNPHYVAFCAWILLKWHAGF